MDGATIYNLSYDLEQAQAEIARLQAKLDQAEAALRAHDAARWSRLHTTASPCDGGGGNGHDD